MTSFADSFRRRFLALALQLVGLLTLVAVATSMSLRVRDVGDAVNWTSARAEARMQDAQAAGVPYDRAARIVVEEYARAPVAVGVYDRTGRLVAGRVEPGTGGAAFFGLHLIQTPLPAGAIVVSVSSTLVLRDIGISIVLALPVALIAALVAMLAARSLERRLLAQAEESSHHERAIEARNEERMRRFVADAGHELRTPLTVIMAYAEILGSTTVPDAAVTQAVAAIRAEGRRMRVLIDKLIMLARLEAPPPGAPTRPVNVTLVAEELRDALRPIAGERIRVEADDDHLVDGEESELREALGAVVDNALCYAPDGPIDIRVTRSLDTARDVVVSIRDRGPGFAEDDLPAIFNRFYRGRHRESAPDGAGLGLAIARVAAERAGGSVVARSRPDGGAEVEFRFPELRPSADFLEPFGTRE